VLYLILVRVERDREDLRLIEVVERIRRRKIRLALADP
jgi:hypothetical protein